MTKLSLIFLGLSLSLITFAQNDLKIDFCGKSANEVKINDLLQCKLISVNNTEYKVASYSLGFMTGDGYRELKIEDNAITEKVIDALKKYTPDLIYIEQIVLINKQGEKTNAEPFKIKN